MQQTDLLAVSSSTSLVCSSSQEELKEDVLNAQHRVEMGFMRVKSEAKS